MGGSGCQASPSVTPGARPPKIKHSFAILLASLTVLTVPAGLHQPKAYVSISLCRKGTCNQGEILDLIVEMVFICGVK